MKDLIEVLTIFLKYGPDKEWPTYCGYEKIYFTTEVRPDELSSEDHVRLEELRVLWDDEEEVWYSMRFGSA